MAHKKKTAKKPIVQYDHKGKKRVNNSPIGLVTLRCIREQTDARLELCIMSDNSQCMF